MSDFIKKYQISEIIPILGLSCLGFYALKEASQMSTFGAIFPYFSGGALLIFSFIQAIMVLFMNRRHDLDNVENLNKTRQILFLMSLFAWALLLPVIGFVISSLIFAMTTMGIMIYEKMSLKQIVLQGASLGVLICSIAFIFTRVLNVVLP